MIFQRLKARLFRIYYRYANAKAWRGHIEDKAFSTLQIPAGTGAIPARVYANPAGIELPLIVYFHGGGWTIGDLESHHPFCQTLSERTGASVIAVDYRLAPEYPFPAGPQDCLGATRWIASQPAGLAPSNGKLVIGGDSAGGNLAASTCLALDTDSRAKVCGIITLYPGVDHYSPARLSHVERANSKPLSMNIMRWFWDTYLGGLEPAQALAAFPLRSNSLHTLPPVFNVSAEFDPLRDEVLAFAEKVSAAGVPVQQRHFEKASHGFACSEGPTEDFNAYMDDLVAWLHALPA